MNRILTLKTGVNYAPRHPPDEETVFPDYIRQNFRRHIWNLDDSDQLAIAAWSNWIGGKEKELNQFLRLKNPVLRSPDLMFQEERKGENEAKPPPIPYTVEELDYAGMKQVLVLDDSSEDEKGEKPSESSEIEKEKKLAAKGDKEENNEKLRSRNEQNAEKQGSDQAETTEAGNHSDDERDEQEKRAMKTKRKTTTTTTTKKNRTVMKMKKRLRMMRKH